MKRIIFILIGLAVCLTEAAAQWIGILEDDARIQKGTLPNGLSYYLVNNSAVKGYADFAFVRKNGLAMEDSTTRGMTYLMECMALTETANFQDGAIFSFIDNMGLNSRDGLLIDAQDYYTSYTFENVPVHKNEFVVDSMLLAIFNMSSAIVLDDRSVSRGKNFFENVFSATYTLERRIKDSLARHYFAGTPLAPASQAELFRRVRRYTTGDVADFYKAYCRPDLQAVIIVGDIDVKAVESKIKALFQVVAKPGKPLGPSSDSLVKAAGGGYFYFCDKEADRAYVSFNYLSNPIAPELRNTAVPFIHNYVAGVGMDIVRRRLQYSLLEAPFYAMAVDAGVYPYMDRVSYRLSVECAPEDYAQGYELLLNEVERLLRYGVSGEEFRRSSEAFMRGLNQTYSKRSALDNRYYRELCMANFTQGYVMAGIELYKSYIETASAVVDSSTVYNFLASVFNDRENRTVVCASPLPMDGLEYFAANPKPYQEDTLKIPVAPRSNIIARTLRQDNMVNKATGVMTRRLTNGVNLACRRMPVEPGRVYFEAVARGGVSLSEDSLSILDEYIGDVARISLNGGMDMFDFQRLQESLDIHVQREITVSDRKITGSFPTDKIEEFLAVVCLYFEGSAADYETFEKFCNMKRGCSPYLYNSPEKVFELLHTKDIRTGRKESALSGSAGVGDGAGYGGAYNIGSAEYDAALKFVNRLFSNVSDFSFIFVGDLDERSVIQTASSVLSGYPGHRPAARKEERRSFYIASYDMVETVKVPMVSPRRLHSCKLTFPSDLRVDDRVLSEITAKVIEREVVRQLSLLGVIANAERRYYRYPEEVLTIDFLFSTYEDMGDLENLFAEIVMDLVQRGVSENEVKAVKHNMALNDALRESTDYTYWKGLLRNRYIDRRDFYTRRKTAMDEITAADVNQALNTVLDKGRVSLLSVVPSPSSSSPSEASSQR